MAAPSSLEVEITARETINPSPPTPHHQKYFKLSLLDQIAPVHYAPLLYFYTSTNDSNPDLISERLKTSLSKTLTKFYPCAGVIKDRSTVECNDNGVVYIQARANCLLSDVLHQPDYKLLREFLPIELESKKAGTSPLLLIQTTFFKCGGMSIGYCFSHNIVDGSSMCTFINTWAAATLPESSEVLPVEYVTSTMFPAEESFVSFPDPAEGELVTKRFVFDESRVVALQNKVSSSNVPKPTRVEAVTMLVWKCATNSSRSNRAMSQNPSPTLSLLILAMNMRKITAPPLPQNSVGNTVGYFSVHKRENEQLELQDLVSQVRKSKEEFKKNGLKTILENKGLISVPESFGKDETLDFSLYSSLCRYPLYEADFGWGKPIWMTFPYFMENLFMFTDAQNGKGIEAAVTLSKEDMALFECDPELLAFATSNPSVLIGY